MTATATLADTFAEKAKLVSAVVSTVKSLEEAFDYTVDLCAKKEACKLLISGCGEPLSPPAEGLCETKQEKVVAAPALPAAQFKAFKKRCDESGFKLLQKGMRDNLGGIDIGFTVADWGIADTGTLVIDSSSEELRLATMISEIHVAVLPISKIVADTAAQMKQQVALMRKTPNYTAFVTGASRTADIERVLALGVHGPLELHILLLED
ncbi:MAG: lactate utilization protein [Desulfovibrionaceae bacterium]|nr:lactate utilization protein [Desulfovibrionaceae bacterium]